MSPFLENWYGEFRPHLTFIVPDGPPLALSDRTLLGVQKALVRYNGERNIYFSVNVVRDGCNKKAAKEDITHAIGLHCDIDHRTGEPTPLEQERIANMARNLPPGVPAPTVRIFTGGGEGWFWRLSEPFALGSEDAIEAVEARNRRLEYELGGDHCHNVDRIMRCPDTWNLPNAKKRAKGRTRIMSSVIEAHWDRQYRFEDFDTAGPRHALVVVSGKGKKRTSKALVIEAQRPGSFRELGIENHGTLCQTIVNPDYVAFGNDRSRAVWYVVNEMVRCGVPGGLIAGTILHPDLPISAHVRAQGNPTKYASRQVAEALRKAKLLDGDITDAEVSLFEAAMMEKAQ